MGTYRESSVGSGRLNPVMVLFKGSSVGVPVKERRVVDEVGRLRDKRVRSPKVFNTLPLLLLSRLTYRTATTA